MSGVAESSNTRRQKSSQLSSQGTLQLAAASAKAPSWCTIHPQHLWQRRPLHTPHLNHPGKTWGPRGGERKLRSLETWGVLMGFGYAEYRLPGGLAGFEPVTICFQHCFQHCFKMPRFRVKNHCVGPRPVPPLAEASVTPASYRKLSWNGQERITPTTLLLLDGTGFFCDMVLSTNLSIYLYIYIAWQ